ncbi:hypothetical protein [Rothia nasisuis]|uniref:hypothetical protein n=1 Tax=Rothia nasisuis TaxID=2109647 RepID=UPI001F480A2E|nr:hypothetical protein [Rothia nasisuis]
MGITFRALLSARALAPGHSIPLTAAWVWGTNGVNKSSLAGVCPSATLSLLARGLVVIHASPEPADGAHTFPGCCVRQGGELPPIAT